MNEMDVWWGGYASRTMIPSFLVCLLASGALLAGAFLVVGLYDLPAVDARRVVYALAGALWGVQIVRWLYRVAGYSYRLTTRRLWCCWGPLGPPVPPLELAQVSQVRLEQTFVERLLKVGRIRLELKNSAAPLILPGVADPGRVADEIRKVSRASN